MTRSIAFLLFGCVAVASCGTSASTGQIEFGPGPSAPAAQTEVVATMATATSGVVAAASTITVPASRSTVAATTVASLATSAETAARGGGEVDLITCVKELPLRERLALLVWPGVDAERWPRAIEAVRSNRLGGVVLMNAAASPERIKSDLARIKAANTRGLLVATDEEGGNPQRLSALGLLSSQEVIAQNDRPADAEEIIAAHGKIIRDAGIDVVLGPVVDVRPAGGKSPIGPGRLFSEEPTTVIDFGQAYVKGWKRAGLLPVLKHFPGHGSSKVDTHNGPGETSSLDDLLKRDLLPYFSLSKFNPAVMLSHLSIPNVTGGQPTSTSKEAIDLLRGMGYENALVMTDSLTMTAVTSQGGVASSAVLAISAGADVALFTTIDPLKESSAVIDALERAVNDGKIQEAAVTISASRVARYFPDQDAFCGHK
jgi:beta-N-acetylhexosaminidase